MSSCSNAPVAAAGGDSKPVPVASTAVLVADSIALKPIDFKQTDSAKLVKKFDSRQNIMLQELEIEGDSIRISFYDNGDIDHDTISVLLNKTPILDEAGTQLTRHHGVCCAGAIKHPVSEIGMFADNLGKYPPNTALMVVTDGLHRYEMYLSSSLSQNATVRLRKKKK